MKNPYRRFEPKISQNGIDHITWYFYNQIMNLFINRFEWSDLPKEIEPYYIERVLFFDGLGAFIYDDVVSMYAFTKLNLSGTYDIYNIPTDRWAYANNGYMKEYGKNNSVIVWDSATAYPYANTALLYAEEMANVWRTRSLNMFAQRTPVALASSDEERVTYQVLGDEYCNYVPIIKVSDTLNLKGLQAISLNAPYVVDKLEDEISVLWGRVLTDLGYESNPAEKRERLIADEVAGNNGQAEANRNIGLGTRRRAADAFNNLFGTNVSVRFRSDLPTPLNRPGDFMKEGGASNE